MAGTKAPLPEQPFAALGGGEGPAPGGADVVASVGSHVDSPLGAHAGSPVRLHAYDTWMSWPAALMGTPVVHLGVELLGWEFAFAEGGIKARRPGSRKMQRCRESVPLGHTHLCAEEVLLALQELDRRFTAETYCLLGRNCQTFALALCERLGLDGSRIPAEYVYFAHPDALLLCSAEAFCQTPGDESAKASSSCRGTLRRRVGRRGEAKGISNGHFAHFVDTWDCLVAALQHVEHGRTVSI
mmetsp:Transcript_97137/g.313681  ORF Transcript_97137/g.313681 Transcript_97137/m.313681 type:complete len:242 (-) Transcript_97137:58-783(-)